MDDKSFSINKNHLVVSGEFKNLRKIRKFIEKFSKLAGFGEDDTYKIQLAVDEACTNIIQHGYGGENRGEIECSCSYTDEDFVVLLQDKGRSFNIDSVSNPDTKTNLENRPVGGLGVYFIRKLMDRIIYRSNPILGGDNEKNVINQLYLIKRRQSK